MVAFKNISGLVLLGLATSAIASPTPNFITDEFDKLKGDYDKLVGKGNSGCTTVATTAVHFGIELITTTIESAGNVPKELVKQLLSCEGVDPIMNAQKQATGASFSVGLNVPYKVGKHEVGAKICNALDKHMQQKLSSKYTKFSCGGAGCQTIMTFDISGSDAIKNAEINKVLGYADKVEHLVAGCPKPTSH